MDSHNQKLIRKEPFSNGEMFSLFLLIIIIFISLLFAILIAFFTGKEIESIPTWLLNNYIRRPVIPSDTPINQHSLQSLELWLKGLGATRFNNPSKWCLVLADWQATIILERRFKCCLEEWRCFN